MNPYKQAQRLLKLAQVVEQNEDHFNMKSWVKSSTNDFSTLGRACNALSVDTPRELATTIGSSCGSAACVGGWAVLTWADEVNPDADIMTEAMKVLGYNYDNVGTLFDAHASWQTGAAAAAELRRRAIEIIKAI